MSERVSTLSEYVCVCLQGTPEAVEEVGAMLVENLPVFMQSGDLEVQERACCILQLMKYIVKLQGLMLPLVTHTFRVVYTYVHVYNGVLACIYVSFTCTILMSRGND